jgi:type II secretory pathway component GspD/PulD (secretin)
VIAAIMLAMVCCAMNAVAQAQAADTKSSAEIYQTLYLTNLTQENDANDLVKDLRNMLSTAKLMYVPSQSAISIRASAEDIALARKILSDLDKTKKIYRLTYTMTEKDSGKTIGVQHFSIIVASGSMSVLKQGSRVPIETNTSSAGSNEVTYLDLGQEIQASLDGYLDGVRLRTKVVQSSIAEEKSSVGTQDPIIRQTTLEGTSTLVQGKTLVLGSLDVPGSTRQQEVEVVSELVR